MEVPRGMEPTGTNGRTRHTLSDPCGSGLVLWWFSRWMARNAVSCGRNDDAGKAFRSRPLSGSRTATIGIVVGSVAGRRFSGRPYRIGFAVVMAQVRRPVPFRTRKLRPGTAMVLHSRGCGRVARRRIQLSGPSGRVPCGIPGRSLFLYSLGGSRRAQRPGNPHFFVSPASRPEHVARGAGRLVLFPVGSVCFGLPKGIFVIPQRLLVNRFFSERAFDTVYDTVF